jgi:hypothetical protein
MIDQETVSTVLRDRQMGGVSGIVTEVMLVPVRRAPFRASIRALGLERQSGPLSLFAL